MSLRKKNPQYLSQNRNLNFQYSMLKSKNNQLLNLNSKKIKEVNPKKHANESKQQAERLKAETFDVRKASELLDKEKFQDKSKEQETKFSVVATKLPN